MNARTLSEMEHMPPPPALSLAVWDSRSGVTSAQWVLEETPVALVYNGISHAVMLATPQDLEDFALGFSLSEEIVRHPRDIFGIDIAAHDGKIEVALRIDGGAMQRLRQTRRMRTGRTGCGLCGVESLTQFDVAIPAVGHRVRVAEAALHRAMAALPARQALHAQTGAAHAAAWADLDGNLLLVREDIGRHNALDKLIGALCARGVAPETGFCLLTSRASYEMVQKAARAGIGLLAAVSAPSAMAVRIAAQAGMTLAGFVRNGRCAIYTGVERIAPMQTE